MHSLRYARRALGGVCTVSIACMCDAAHARCARVQRRTLQLAPFVYGARAPRFKPVAGMAGGGNNYANSDNNSIFN